MQQITISIRSFLAGFFLCLFAFAVTPKVFLHHILATHVDNTKSPLTKKLHFSTAGFQCHYSDLVSNSPFDDTQQTLQLRRFSMYNIHYESLAADYQYSTSLFVGLRSPPAV